MIKKNRILSASFAAFTPMAPKDDSGFPLPVIQSESSGS
jgi:hypothetical protein